MSETSAGLAATGAIARRLGAADDAIVAAVRTAAHTPAWLRPVGAGDGRSAATLAHHIAVGYEHGLRWAQSIKETRTMPDLRLASVDAENAEHAVIYASPSPEETEELLTANCALLVEFARSLVDAELEVRSHNEVLGRTWSIRDVLETTIHHTQRHTEQFVRATAA